MRIMKFMSGDPPSFDSDPANETLLAIDQLVEEVARLSQAELPPRSFHGELLERAVRALAAVGGALWLQDEAGRFQLEYQVNLAATGAVASAENKASHEMLLAAAAAGGETKIASPRAGLTGEAQAANPTDYLLILSPLVRDGAPFGVVELFLRPGVSPAVQQGYARVLAALCELAADFHRHRELRELRRRSALWSQVEHFAERTHASLDLRSTAFAIANEGRSVIGCDRLSVAVRRGRECRLSAVSGLEKFDRRSPQIRRLQRLIDRVVKTGEPLWYSGDANDLPPQLEEALQTYLDESHVRQIVIFPLHEPAAIETSASAAGKPRSKGPARIVGALVGECFEADPALDALRWRMETVARHSQAALANALTFQSLPFLPLLRFAGWFLGPGRLSWSVLLLILLAASAAALAFVPADFQIEARGELQPQRRADIFAPQDGVVSQVFVRHGEHVDLGDGSDPKQGLLAVLTDSKLDYEVSRVAGELRTSGERIRTATIRMQQLQNARTTEEVFEREKLAAEVKELEKQLDSLREQRKILQRQQSEMSVRSPIDGEVLTWNVEQILDRRPVRRGQLLMKIADLASPWVLELYVPDHHIGHVLEAQAELGNTAQEVSFILATDPERTFTGQVSQIALTSENDETHGASVLVTVKIDAKTRRRLTDLRPGATVIGRISCGRRCLGYVWFHDLIDAAYTWVWF